jgi:hypothetical protein
MSAPTNEELHSALEELQGELDTVKSDTSNCSSTRTRVLILTEAVQVLARGVKLSAEDQKEFDDIIGQL